MVISFDNLVCFPNATLHICIAATEAICTRTREQPKLAGKEVLNYHEFNSDFVFARISLNQPLG